MNNGAERLFVIGAGASAAAPYRLPTLKTLAWRLSRTLRPAERESFARVVYECLGEKLARKAAIDFEELLNRLDPSGFEYLRDLPGGRNALAPRARRLALAGLRRFLRARCRACAGRKGPYDRLAASLGPESAIVSFNWDVLVEVALRRAGRGFEYVPSGPRRDATVLLKPHGSINWFALLDRELLSVDLRANIGVLGGDLSHYMLYLKNPVGRLDLGRSNTFVKAALAPVPAIVPPGATRLLSVGGAPRDGFVDDGHRRAMTAVWTAFHARLQSARELVVIGYSLPGTDAVAIEMLRRWARLPGRRRVLLIDPDVRVAARYEAILEVPVRRICRDFASFDMRVLD